MNSAMPVLKRVLAYGGVVAVAIALLGSVVGFLTDGTSGLVSALIGAAMAFLFLGVTAASILAANRIAHGGWLLKFALFLTILILLKDQPWINSVVLLLTVIVAVISSLIVDVVVIARSRQPYVDVTLPQAPQTGTVGAAPSTPL